MRPSQSIGIILIAAILWVAPDGASAGGGIGCCTIGSTCSDGVGSQACEMSGGAFVDGGTCSSTPNGVCEPPPTPTPEIACCERDGACSDNAIFMICELGGGTYVLGGTCITETGTCALPPTPTATPNTGCCQLDNSCADNAIFMTCELSQGDYFPGEVCDAETDNCMPAPTATPTATPTSTPLPNGSDCSTPAECASTFCVDGVCCETACDGTTDRCDISGSQGECTALNATPATSARALAVMAMLLCGIAALALRRVAR